MCRGCSMQASLFCREGGEGGHAWLLMPYLPTYLPGAKFYHIPSRILPSTLLADGVCDVCVCGYVCVDVYNAYNCLYLGLLDYLEECFDSHVFPN